MKPKDNIYLKTKLEDVLIGNITHTFKFGRKRELEIKIDNKTFYIKIT